MNQAHIVFLRYKLTTNAKSTDDLSIGFDRDRKRRPDELARNKNVTGKYQVRLMLNDIFDFDQLQKNVRMVWDRT